MTKFDGASWLQGAANGWVAFFLALHYSGVSAPAWMSLVTVPASLLCIYFGVTGITRKVADQA